MWSHFSGGPRVRNRERASLWLAGNIQGEVEGCLQGLLSLSSLCVIFCLSDQYLLNRYVENLYLNLCKSPVLLWSPLRLQTMLRSPLSVPPATRSDATCTEGIPPMNSFLCREANQWRVQELEQPQRIRFMIVKFPLTGTGWGGYRKEGKGWRSHMSSRTQQMS